MLQHENWKFYEQCFYVYFTFTIPVVSYVYFLREDCHHSYPFFFNLCLGLKFWIFQQLKNCFKYFFFTTVPKLDSIQKVQALYTLQKTKYFTSFSTSFPYNVNKIEKQSRVRKICLYRFACILFCGSQVKDTYIFVLQMTEICYSLWVSEKKITKEHT